MSLNTFSGKVHCDRWQHRRLAQLSYTAWKSTTSLRRTFHCVFGPPLVMAEVLDENRPLEGVVAGSPTLDES